MPRAGARSPLRAWASFRDWAVWELPRWLSCYVVTVITAYALMIGIATAFAPFRVSDVALFGILLVCSAVTVELTRRAGEPGGLIKDVYAVWDLPIAILLPPLYVLLVPIPRLALTQWRTRQTLVYRRIFSAAAVGLAYAGASVAFHAGANFVGVAPGSGDHAVVWTLLVACCGLLRLAINRFLVLAAVKGADPATKLRPLIAGRETLYNDLAELCMGVLVTFAAAHDALLVLYALPLVILLQRSLRHRQLVNESRVDGKTGLLNAATWQREAQVEITRAIRTHTPLAVAIADIDHFKLVNDTYGHLVGDEVLAGIARAMTALLRDYDIVGRFGGEEFVILLPQTSADEVKGIAERLREKLAEIIVPISAGVSAQSLLQVTVSIGIATLDGSRRDLDDMLAAADAALYKAKNTGRNKVCVLADSSPGG
ncbi:MAG TPA: GGDEF domain-containing protein [Streptosporangiaceae bacterium]|nr:GGDEF domain-containing protein [Streptosporangiaceae bacterium]